jgi:formylglycine-generating enzyme required for sulfatase activity
MLTALAVVHWNERRLPEQRADLYESILVWLARSRERRPGREPAEGCLLLLQHLALGMLTHAGGRQVQVRINIAAEIIATEFAGPNDKRVELALRFLEDEEVDSGIVTSRGKEIRFWHLTFQEYLAARAIAGQADVAQHQLLLDGDSIYRSEWREIAMLLVGILRVRQGPGKVDGLFAAILDNLGKGASLAKQARCAGLLGAMLKDLHPLGYEARDRRYTQLLTTVLEIFTQESAKAIDLNVRIEAAEALGQAGDPRLSEPHWIKMSGGRIIMGAQSNDPSLPNYDSNASSSDGPVREVEVSDFLIARYPVTVSEYKRFVEGEGYKDVRWWSAGKVAEFESPIKWDEQIAYPNRPVVGVSWYEAVAYCAWANVRLATEAEWERTARGLLARRCPWGDTAPDSTRANSSETQLGHPTPVGLYPCGATPDGVEDLAGNVWEWTADIYHSRDFLFAPVPFKARSADEDRQNSALRGGSWNDDHECLRAAYRIRFEPSFRDATCGFRAVRGAAT